MKKTIFNTTYIKKNLDKNPLFFGYIDEKNIICWNSRGLFAIKCNKLLFDTEIKSKIPTEEKEIPSCIINTFDAPADTIIKNTSFYIELKNMNCKLFLNDKNKYLLPIDLNLYNILNFPTETEIHQDAPTRPVFFINNFSTVILMPVRNDYIKEKIIDIYNALI